MLQLPPRIPSFFLRFDFPIEAGYLDLARSPLPAHKVLAECQKQKKEFSPQLLEYVNASRACRKLRRFYQYTVISDKNATDPILRISDGDTPLWLQWNGLFADLLCRVDAHLSTMGEAPKALFARESPEGQQYAPGAYSVLHDTESSRAVVILNEACTWYLEDNSDANISRY
ncbi:hypothetical protein DB347_01450 [Opitutaceae bacterium EW11]|nr:hypothetical protein DB347_01450 [Opitutaceae bacterium EW11]